MKYTENNRGFRTKQTKPGRKEQVTGRMKRWNLRHHDEKTWKNIFLTEDTIQKVQGLLICTNNEKKSKQTTANANTVCHNLHVKMQFGTAWRIFYFYYYYYYYYYYSMMLVSNPLDLWKWICISSLRSYDKAAPINISFFLYISKLSAILSNVLILYTT